MKNFKFTIAFRLGLGFGILTAAVVFSFVLIYQNLKKNREISSSITDIYTPSVSKLNQLYEMINNSKMLIKNWVFIERKEETVDKEKLKKIHRNEYKDIRDEIGKLAKAWDEAEQATFNDIKTSIEDSLFARHKTIMDALSSFANYDDQMVYITVSSMVENDGEVMKMTERILKELTNLLNKMKERANTGNDEMVKSFDAFQEFVIVVGILLVIAALLIAWLTTRTITNPVNHLRKVLLQMSKGILPDEQLTVRNDEIGEMSNALNLFIQGLRKTSEFALEIGKEKFNTEFTPLGDQDILGNALIIMRKNLQDAANKEQQRKKEDEQRNWGTLGLAQFAEILRKDNDNMELLSYNIISNLVKYLGANQGGMFILNEENKEELFLEMTACYAYDRKKFMEKNIKKGEGLVGTCFLEKQTIYMTEIPDSYLNITSGLGKSNPRCLLIVPLKINEEIFGIIEVASFKNLEKYQIEFVEKVGESIASTISSVKINTRTAKLLRESKEQGEQLIQQEEEMRQNLEELQATQEESDRRITNLEATVAVYNEGTVSFEMDVDGNIMSANEYLIHLFGTTEDQIAGKNHQLLISHEHLDLDKYKQMMKDLKKGIKCRITSYYETPKGKIQILENYIPVKNSFGEFAKIVVIGFDITK